MQDRVIPTSPCVRIPLPKGDPKSALVPITTDLVVALQEEIDARYRAFVIAGAGLGSSTPA